MSRPAYRVPTMVEIRALPPNGLRVISTFAGAGGSSTGYRMAGYQVIWANEFVPAAAATYRANASPGTIVDTTDIREVTPESILAATGLAVGDLDIFDGSPPCSGFSTVGIREAGWGVTKAYSSTRQRVDDLFFEYTRLLRGLQPRVFVAENVSGLVRGVAKGYFKRIMAEMKACGYRVEARLLDAQWLGVPQARKRIIFIGVRRDLGRLPVHPGPLSHRYAVRDVLPALELQGGGPCPFGESSYQRTDRPSPTIGSSLTFGNGRSPSSVVVETPPTYVHDTGGEFGQGDGSDRPSPTIVATPASLNHYRVAAADGEPGPVWREHLPYCPETGKALILRPTASMRYTPPPGRIMRRLTIPELRLLSSFPADFALTGSYEERWERCGRAVPPLMMRAIASTIARDVLCAG